MTHLRPDCLAALLCALALSACAAAGPVAVTPAAPDPRDAFFAVPADPGAALPAEGIYPRGRRMAFMGYSGKPERDLTRGFSVAGPVYGNQDGYVQGCIDRHQPVVVQVRAAESFNDKVKRPVYDPAKAAQTAKAIVARWAKHNEVVWWAIEPEELRPWRKDEMAYLAVMAGAIREADPQKRPVFIYNPNNRDAGSLAAIAKHVDILGKGAYVNSWGAKNARAWVRWSIDQETAAAKGADHPVTPIVMPELCADPAPAEDALIESWVRHDVYLGLSSGAQGVLIWSLFPRGGVKRTWGVWYEAYARCGRELGQERKLGEVFLFGAPRSDIRVKPADGAKQAAALVVGGEHGETETTSAAERASRQVDMANVTVCERAFGAKRYLFVVNSTGAPRAFEAAGWPAGVRMSDVFTGQPLPGGQALQLNLPAWGVAGVVLER